MKTKSINSIPSFNLLINVETIFAALCIQYGNQLRRNPATTPHITTTRLMSYARQCFRGFTKNLKAAVTYRDHIKLHHATSVALASNGKEFLAALPASSKAAIAANNVAAKKVAAVKPAAKKAAAKPAAKTVACTRVRASVKTAKRTSK